MKSNEPTFVDRLTVTLSSGDGGPGSSSFRREYRIPRGGPDGGDGGKGGDVYFLGTPQKHTLLDYKYKRNYAARSGSPGTGQRCSGKKGEDLVLPVPLGTQVYKSDTQELLCDVTEAKKYKILEGGKGGLGNWHFKNSRTQAPEYAQPGLPGTTLDLTLELKLLADVGLIGFPNAGKSTLISVLSKARPKIAPYPFTTLNPQLGVLEHKGKELIIADLPGLTEGASEGVGLGHRFLRHAERTRFLLHVISLDPHESHTPLERYHMIQKEILSHSHSGLKMNKLSDLEQIIVLTKMDLCPQDTWQREVDTLISTLGKTTVCISSVMGKHIPELKDLLIQQLDSQRQGDCSDGQ